MLPNRFQKTLESVGANPKLIIKSDRDRGKKRDGTPAADLMYGDYTKDQIKAIRWMFKVDIMDYESLLWPQFEAMATTIFAVGDLEENIKSMIAHFKGNTGGDYRNPILTKAARDHELSQKFEKEVRESMISAIKKHKGDPTQIKTGDVTRKTGVRFSSNTDTFAGGLTIAVNDVWAWKVELIDYALDGADFKGTYRVTLFDHFGLDQPDVDKKFGLLAGFRSWFILQHYDKYAYRPFVSVMQWDSTFQGKLLVAKKKGAHHAVPNK